MKQQYMHDIFDFVNTAAGKVVAVLVAFALTLTLSSIAFAVEEAIQAADAAGTNTPAATGAETSANKNSGEATESTEESPESAGETEEAAAEASEEAESAEAAEATEKDIDETIKDAVMQDEPATEDETPTGKVDEASISLSTEHCAIKIGRAALVGGTVTVPLREALEFDVVPDNGYVVESVYISAGGLPVPWMLDASDLPFIMPAEYVDSNLTISATAVLYDPSNPPVDPTPEPIEDDTEVVPDGFYEAPTLSIADMESMYMGVELQLYNDDFDATVEGLRDGDELIINGYTFTTNDANITAGKDAGTHTITVTDYWIKRTETNRDVTREYQPIDLSNAVATLTIHKAPLYIVSPSATKVYDGEPLTYAGEGGQYDFTDVEWLMEEGMLNVYDGPAVLYTLFDYFEGEYMWVTGSQTNVGASYNRVEIREDVQQALAKNYNVEYHYGTLRVVTEEPVIYAPSASKVYDGTPLGVSVDDIYWDNLPVGFTVQATINNASRTDAGRQTTSIDPASVHIIDADGNDVTSVYAGTIQFGEGELEIERAVLYVITYSATKVADGTPLTGEGVMTGLVNGETATLQMVGSQTDSGASRNTFMVQWDGTAKQSNYRVVAGEIGTLTVTPAPSTGGNAGGGNGGNGGSAGYAGGAAVDAGAGAATVVPATTQDSPATTDEESTEEEGINETVAAVAQGMQNAMQFLNGQEPTDLSAPAVEESLADDETPLGVFDKPIDCWVHWYTILGLIATAIYGAVVMFFRRAYAYELESREANILGAPVGMAQPHIPAGTSGQAGRRV